MKERRKRKEELKDQESSKNRTDGERQTETERERERKERIYKSVIHQPHADKEKTAWASLLCFKQNLFHIFVTTH